jgi:hypothetical protein
MSSTISDLRPLATVSGRRPLWFAAPAAALIYPFPLMAFHAATGMIATGAVTGWLIAALSLALAIALPVVALLAAMRLSLVYRPTAAELLARRLALLAVAAPPLFTFIGVIFLLLGAPQLDVWFVSAMWLLLAVAIRYADNRAPAAMSAPNPHGKMRVAHGAAAVLVLVYIAFHFSNHLFGLIGDEAHTAVMKLFRVVYRAAWVEPILLAGFAFLIVSGAQMAWRLTERGTDRYRTFQIAAGIYLIFAVISHLNAVLYLARVHLGIDTDWAFATGAPVGMIKDAWSIRLVPYYLLGAFFVVAHTFSGLRVVMLAHGARKPLADTVMLCGAAFAALLSTVIILAMCGLRLHFV